LPPVAIANNAASIGKFFCFDFACIHWRVPVVVRTRKPDNVVAIPYGFAVRLTGPDGSWCFHQGFTSYSFYGNKN
jgi:hypothetical protein